MDSVTKKDKHGHWRLYLLVSVSGAAVLAVELLGTRLLGPFYGVSLFLWSALISVTLAALSAGYAAPRPLAAWIRSPGDRAPRAQDRRAPRGDDTLLPPSHAARYG